MNSLSVVATPPRVGSRRTRTSAPVPRMASHRPFSGAQSEAISPCIIPLRASMMAVPWSPTMPETMTASPSLRFFGLRPGYFTKPIPAVLIYILSPLPRSTTFVSPVTTCTPALSAVHLMDSTIFSKSSTGSPSSIIKEQLKYFGTAPHIAMSFTVPQTESLPISPPGKNIGSTTKLSVEKASFSAPSTIAPSPKASSAGFDSAGTISFSIRRAVFLPPLP